MRNIENSDRNMLLFYTTFYHHINHFDICEG